MFQASINGYIYTSSTGPRVDIYRKDLDTRFSGKQIYTKINSKCLDKQIKAFSRFCAYKAT